MATIIEFSGGGPRDGETLLVKASERKSMKGAAIKAIEDEWFYIYRFSHEKKAGGLITWIFTLRKRQRADLGGDD